MKHFILLFVISLSGDLVQASEVSTIQSIRNYFNPLLSENPDYVQYYLEKLVKRCNRRTLDLAANAYMLEQAGKSYHASVNSIHLHEVRQSCRKKINRYKMRIKELKELKGK